MSGLTANSVEDGADGRVLEVGKGVFDWAEDDGELELSETAGDEYREAELVGASEVVRVGWGAMSDDGGEKSG